MGRRLTLPTDRGRQSVICRSQATCRPASFNQEWHLSTNHNEPGSKQYHMSVSFEVNGLLDLAALNEAISEVLLRHDVFRTSFLKAEGQYVTEVRRRDTFQIDTASVHSAPINNINDAKKYATDYSGERFDLTADTLLRCLYIQLSPLHALLTFVTHHIVFDGWSASVLFAELSQLYNSLTARRTVHLTDLPIQYSDFAIWQRQLLSGCDLDLETNYWEQRIAGCSNLHIAFPLREVTAVGVVKYFNIDEHLFTHLLAVCAACRTTLSTVMLTAYLVTLSVFYNIDFPLVYLAGANRSRTETHPVIGFFSSCLLVGSKLTNDLRLCEIVRRVHACLFETLRHENQHISSIRALEPFRRQFKYTFHEEKLENSCVLQTVSDTGLSITRTFISGPQTNPSRMISLSVYPSSARIRGQFQFHSAAYSDEAMQMIVQNFVSILHLLVAQRQATLGQVELQLR